ncbi:MAG: hypothetical protein V2J55_22350, partial [Candidatus Competibacteraceae bacterium]|nr:hypothetical protein [Candidatus Competibacteraceae bacterium]
MKKRMMNKPTQTDFNRCRSLYQVLAKTLISCLLLAGLISNQANSQEYDGRCEALLPNSDSILRSEIIEDFRGCLLRCWTPTTFTPFEFPSDFQVDDCDAQPIIQRLGGISRVQLDFNLRQALDQFEQQTVHNIIEQHQLPAADLSRVSRVMGYARNDMRALLFAKLLNIAEMPPSERTSDEQLIAEAYANELQETRIAAIEFSIDEYQRWESAPCDYVPPEGFIYEPAPIYCDGTFSLTEILANVQPPLLEDFIAYGAAEVRRPLLETEGALIVAETADAGLAVGIGVTLGIAAFAAAAITITAIINFASVILPFAGLMTIATGVGSAVAAVVLSILGPVLIIVLAVVIGTLQGIFVFTAAEIPDKLQEALDQAQQTRPPLVEVIGTEAGREEFFTTFLVSTLPNNIGVLPPIPVDSEQRFLVVELDINRNPIPGTETVVESIEFVGWNDNPFAFDLSTRISQSWFIPTVEVEGEPLTTMLFGMKRRGGDGSDWQTWVVGDQFLHLPRHGNPREDGELSDTMFFFTRNFEPRLASIVTEEPDETPPEISEIIDGVQGENDWYVSDVSLTWTVEDPESELIDLSDGCNPTDITDDGIAHINCTAESAGGENSSMVTI